MVSGHLHLFPAASTGLAVTQGAPMPRAVITQEVYDRLLAAYREVPGNVTRASRMSGCGLMMARRAWEAGWPRLPWAVPIQAVLLHEQEEARAAVAREADRERERQEAIRETARADAIKARTEEGQAVRMARGNAIGILAVTNKVAVGVLKFADVVKAKLETMTSTDMDPKEAVQLIERAARAARQAGELAHRAVVMERLYLGKPTEILGVSTDEPFSPEQALEELANAADDRERYLRAQHPGELRVIEGGKSLPPLPPPPPPTGTEK